MPKYHSYGVLSYPDFIARVSRRPSVKLSYDSSSSMDPPEGDFRLLPNFEAALTMARTGWREGAEALRDCDAIVGGVEDGTAWGLEVAGSFPCVPAFVAGDMETMWQHETHPEPQKRIHIVYDACFPAFIPATWRMEYAKALAALVRSLEAGGISVALTTVDAMTPCHRSRNPVFLSATTVREYGTPLDLDRLAFTAHPDFSRRLNFAHREMWDECRESGCAMKSKMYGFSYDCVTLEAARQILGDDAANAFVMPDTKKTYEANIKGADRLLAHFKTKLEYQMKAPQK